MITLSEKEKETRLKEVRKKWEAAEKRRAQYEARRKKLMKTHKHEMRGIEQEFHEHALLDPKLREIETKYRSSTRLVREKLVCPSCGDEDRGNIMNGKPWCFKCNSLLMPKEKVAKWRKNPTIKKVKSSLKDEVDHFLKKKEVEKR